jgi:cytochrome c oxidase assembly protein subunit 15
MKIFQRLGIVSIVIVYLLILAGGIVRSTGSGMGCPDWPRCFGRIIPPTDESELPPDYQEKYKDHGYATMKFNPVKTWIEYVNRLLGALTGIVVLVFFISSFALKNNRNITVLSGFVLLLVIIEGVIGKYVVSTNLKPIMVSIHMWGSIAVILLLIYTVAKLRKNDLVQKGIVGANRIQMFNLVLIALTVAQVIMGTMVRQEVDIISMQFDYSQREIWISQLGNIFYFHRSFSIILVLAHLSFFFMLKKSAGKGSLQSFNLILLALLLAETAAGITMAYFDMPAFIQPVHMLFGSLILGAQFIILIILQFSSQKIFSPVFSKNVN